LLVAIRFEIENVAFAFQNNLPSIANALRQQYALLEVNIDIAHLSLRSEQRQVLMKRNMSAFVFCFVLLTKRRVNIGHGAKQVAALASRAPYDSRRVRGVCCAAVAAVRAAVDHRLAAELRGRRLASPQDRADREHRALRAQAACVARRRC
jgi:hypothetical protein